jgi:ADP-heptose:LPS heptosyltransferase
MTTAERFDRFAKTTGRMLIRRTIGGIGDILMHRMLLQDLRSAAPGVSVSMALPKKLLSLVTDHPFIDQALRVDRVNPDDYAFVYDTTHVAGGYEYHLVRDGLPVDRHRSDIWAAEMGITLTRHEMLLSFTDEERGAARDILAPSEGAPTVAVAPRTASPHKDWTDKAWAELLRELVAAGYHPVVFHDKPLHKCFKGTHATGLSLRNWMATVDACDYVITLATGMFCLANGLHKPTLALFGCEDLEVFGRYFPEMMAIQRRAEHGSEWKGCPCWRNECAKLPRKSRKGNGGDASHCLRSITPAEVMEAFHALVARPKPEYYDQDYFERGGCKGWYDADAFALENEFHRARAEDVVAVLQPPAGAAILDVGTARGNVPYWLTEMGFVGYGLDKSRWAAGEGSHLPAQRVRCGDISNGNPWDDTAFDFVTSREVLEHLPEADVAAALGNIAAMLKPGGRTLHWIATNRGGKEEAKRSNADNFDISHVCIRNPDWWIDRFAEAGMALDAEVTVAAMHRPDAVRFNWDCLVFRKGP